MKIEKITSEQSIIDYALEQAVWAGQIASGQIDDINQALAKLEREIKAIVLALDNDNLGSANKKTINKLLSDMRNAETSLLSAQLDETLNNIGELSALVAATEVNALAKLTNRKIKQLSKPFQTALNSPVAAVGQMLDSFIESIDDIVKSKLEQAIRRGMANQWTLQETVQELSSVFDVIKRNDVESIVLTATHHAYERARDGVYKANGIDKVQCVTTLDTRTCRNCAALGGLIVEAKNAPLYPLHPRCRCVTIPYLPELAAFDKGATRSSIDGYVDANQSSLDWYRKHDKKWLSDVFGPTIADVIKKPSMTDAKFRSLVLDKRYKSRTIEQIKEKAAEMGL